MLINTDSLPIDLAAECLRKTIFGDSYHPSESCINKDFDQMTLPSFYERVFGDWFDNQASINFYQNFLNNQVVLWQNDGDCTLIIIDKNTAYLNSDAKKNYGWKRIPIGH